MVTPCSYHTSDCECNCQFSSLSHFLLTTQCDDRSPLTIIIVSLLLSSPLNSPLASLIPSPVTTRFSHLLPSHRSLLSSPHKSPLTAHISSPVTTHVSPLQSPLTSLISSPVTTYFSHLLSNHHSPLSLLSSSEGTGEGKSYRVHKMAGRVWIALEVVRKSYRRVLQRRVTGECYKGELKANVTRESYRRVLQGRVTGENYRRMLQMKISRVTEESDRR